MLFDGCCNLCNRGVEFIIRRDPRKHIRLAAQQSAAGRRLLAEAGLAAEAGLTMVAMDGPRVYTRSTAALQVARRLRFPWPLAYALVVVPRCLRDAAYDTVSRHRDRWFGRRDTCRVPTDQERDRFVE